jgi:hypothetical protein
MRPSRETLVVAALCFADLISTLLLVRHHQAGEGNFLMDFYLQQGMPMFVAAKCLLFVPALLMAEWYRRKNPRLIIQTLRLVIVLYAAFYAVGVVHANHHVLMPASAATGEDSP